MLRIKFLLRCTQDEKFYMFPLSTDQEEFNTTHMEVFKVHFTSLTISRDIDTSYEL